MIFFVCDSGPYSGLSKMTTQGAALQTQNNELVKCIEELREKRDLLNRSIREEEAEKAKIQQDLQVPNTSALWCKISTAESQPTNVS
jgi:predicted RNase H-like nuclease (RuvC/YqgF family)